MKTVYADRFLRESVLIEYDRQSVETLRGAWFGADLSLPSLVNLYPGKKCVITHLEADLSNAQLGQDFSIENALPHPVRQTVWMDMAASEAGKMFPLLAVPGILFVGVTFLNIWRFAGSRPVLLSVVFIVVCVVSGAISWANSLPVVETQHWYSYSFPVREAVSKVHRLGIMKRDEVEAYLRNTYGETINKLTGEPVAFEECPGDLVVMSDERGVVVRAFDTGLSTGLVGKPYDFLVRRD